MVLAVRIDNSAPGSSANPDGSVTFPLSTLVTPFPMNAAFYPSSSGNVANASATASFAAAPGKYNYICGVHVTGLGATAASTVLFAISGLQGQTFSYIVAVPAGVTVPITPLFLTFPSPLQGYVNTAVFATLPALGAGNTNACVNMWGYQV
jgi:hypothetical protein